MEVYAGPREAVSIDGERLIQFGRTHTSLAYFKEPLRLEGEANRRSLSGRMRAACRKTADGFLGMAEREVLVGTEAIQEKGMGGHREWSAAVYRAGAGCCRGRKRFRWRVVGIAPNGDLRFEVHNGSDMTLPYYLWAFVENCGLRRMAR